MLSYFAMWFLNPICNYTETDMTRVVGPCTVIGQFWFSYLIPIEGKVLTERVRRKVVIIWKSTYPYNVSIEAEFIINYLDYRSYRYIKWQCLRWNYWTILMINLTGHRSVFYVWDSGHWLEHIVGKHHFTAIVSQLQAVRFRFRFRFQITLNGIR